jgi:selenocysteine lyase/cysteine desulfurase
MSITRRNLLAGAGGLAATAALGRLSKPLRGATPRPGAPTSGQLEWPTQDSGFPRKDDFAIPEDYTYINGAFTHPMPLVALEAVKQRAEQRSAPGAPRPDGPRRDPKELFARLINADPGEIAYMPNTSTGENLVVDALRIPQRAGSGINVVTDALPFGGSVIHLMELGRRGLGLRIVGPRG